MRDLQGAETGTERAEPLGRLVCLDGLRGVLAVYVMLGHAAPMIPGRRR